MGTLSARCRREQVDAEGKRPANEREARRLAEEIKTQEQRNAERIAALEKQLATAALN
jgi:hypothetical protein